MTITRIIWLTALLLAGASCGGEGVPRDHDVASHEPARVAMHRLNRVEYNNTVRDLLGTSLTPADRFPADDMSHGFDNIADVLSLSPVQVEMYHRAAAELVDDVMAADKVATLRIEAEDLSSEAGAAAGDAFKLVTEGALSMSLQAAPGTYEVTALAWVERVGPTPIRMSLHAGGAQVQAFDVLADADRPGAYGARVILGDPPQQISLVYENDNDTGPRYRNLVVDSITIRGPLGVAAANPLRKRIMVCTPPPGRVAACARDIVSAFGSRAWRRPLTDKETDDLVGFVEAALAQGDDFDTAIALALRAMLASPKFLFRIEQDWTPGTRPGPLDAFEVASRLSYFLWSTMPDEELFEVAAAGTLSDDAVLDAQVERMLSDPKAAAFTDNFVGQWLTLRGLDAHEPDSRSFPDYDIALKNDMATETKTLFRALLDANRPAQELLTVDFTYANERIAAHYGLQPVSEEPGAFGPTRLPRERAGVLGHASILTVTSHPTRTSPVKRGKWVLEQLLCTAPPPPPPGVAGLAPEQTQTASLRARMEQHRSDPTCAACHQLMDPIGFGLEHFDGTGKWREQDGDYAIDASGTLPGGQAFEGGVELAALIAADPRFPRCVVKQLHTYALGRAPESDINPFTEAWLARGAGLRDLVKAVATSAAFRHHRASTEKRP